MNLPSKVLLFRQSKLFQVFYTTGFATGIKILSTILLSKIIAVHLGLQGLALLGQLTNFVTIALLLATGGFTNGVIKYVSEYSNSEKLGSIIKQSFKITLIIAAIVGAILIICSGFLSNLCFNTFTYYYVFLFLGISIIFYASANFFTAVLNGLADFKNFNRINIANSIASLIISAVLILKYGITGALVAVAINQTFSCIIILFFIRGKLTLFKDFTSAIIEKDWVKKLMQFSLMAIVTALMVPTTQIFIRKILFTNIGSSAAGEWEAINRISNLYLTFLINIMLVYYLPKLSAETNKLKLKAEIKKGFAFFTPIVIVAAVAIYMLRYFIIYTFLSADFIGMENFFIPQLIGDIFKILSFLFAYLVIAKGLTIFFIFSEVITSIIYATASYFLMNEFGTIGAVYAYMIVFIFYFIAHFLIIGKFYLNENFNSRSWIWKGGRL